MSDSISPTCPKCNCRRTSRVKRNSFLQNFVLPYLEMYPWECSGCRSVFIFKSRGQQKSRSRTTSEIDMPTVRG